MSKIKDIQNAVTSNGMREWTDQRVRQAMREYAKAVAADALKRAADTATVWVETPINGTEFESVTKELGDGFNETITVFKDRILSTPINTDL